MTLTQAQKREWERRHRKHLLVLRACNNFSALDLDWAREARLGWLSLDPAKTRPLLSLPLAMPKCLLQGLQLLADLNLVSQQNINLTKMLLSEDASLWHQRAHRVEMAALRQHMHLEDVRCHVLKCRWRTLSERDKLHVLVVQAVQMAGRKHRDQLELLLKWGSWLVQIDDLKQRLFVTAAHHIDVVLVQLAKLCLNNFMFLFLTKAANQLDVRVCCWVLQRLVLVADHILYHARKFADPHSISSRQQKRAFRHVELE